MQLGIAHSDPIAPVILGVTGILAFAILGRVGARLIYCPLCGDEKRPRLYISVERGGWICFRCHERGTMFDLFTRGFGQGGSEAMHTTLQFRIGADETFERAWSSGVVHTPNKATKLYLPEGFKFFERNTDNEYSSYLTNRGVSLDLAVSRGLGYVETGRLGRRVVVPVVNDSHLFTYIARSVNTKCPSCGSALDLCECSRRFPKVLTPSKAEGDQRTLTLFQYDSVYHAKPPKVYVMEGVFDALRYPSEAVALMGSFASATQVALLAGLARRSEMVICLDGDYAGHTGAIKLAEALTSELVPVKVATLPEETDPGSLTRDDFDAVIAEARQFVL